MEEQKKYAFPTGKKEMIFCGVSLITGLAMANCIYAGGFNLGFAVALIANILCGAGYLAWSGCKGNGYTSAILGLCLVIGAGFCRSDDGFVKFVMVAFLLVGVNLAMCLAAGQNRRMAGGVRSVLDAPRALFVFGMGKLEESFRGIIVYFREGGEGSRRTGAALLGVLISIPLVAVVIPLLMSADAAFNGLMELLPEFELFEWMLTLVYGSAFFAIAYTRGVALRHSPKDCAPEKQGKRLHPFTINTVLGAVCFVYAVYLVSQLAYFVGGFSGILPEGYTAAEYARRGFFEMAWLCGINLGIITFCMSLVQRQEAAPRVTKVLCLFVGLVTLFLVAASCAKMILYIQRFGLTRLRVLTMAIIVFLGITTGLVIVWLFRPKFAYMKVVVITALVIGAAVLWMDVDTQVARYNVNAYLDGTLAAVDVRHLGTLGNGAVPYIEKLCQADDPEIATKAAELLEHWFVPEEDLRGWNYVNQITLEILPKYDAE